MTRLIVVRLYLAVSWLLAAGTSELASQNPSPVSLTFAVPAEGLFDREDVLHITLRGNMHDLLNDKSKEPPAFPLALSFMNDDSTKLSLPVEVKTRGHFRRTKGNCVYPPLLISFPNDGAQLFSIFREQKNLKLVVPCSKDENYIVREYLVYKLYNLFTPMSFRARLVKITLEDFQSKKETPPFYGIFLEEEAQMARRNHAVSIEKRLQPTQLQTDAFLTMAVFQYLIGNTDWSVQYRQNIKLLVADTSDVPIAVPYDFDHAGIVDAPYARPAEELQMRSVQERRFRGYCVTDMHAFDKTIAQFIRLKKDVYNLYNSCTSLEARHLKSAVKYIDGFYKIIENPKAWQSAFAYPCDPNGTGNVVVKGLGGN